MSAYLKCLIVICMLILLVGSFAHGEEQKEPAAAVVNGDRIPMSALDKGMQAEMAGNPELRSTENIAALRKMRLDYLINQQLIFQEGKKAGLVPQDAEIDAEFMKIKQRFPSQEAFEQILKQQGLTEEKLRGLISRGLTVQKVLAVKIEPTVKPVIDKDIADFYEANKDGFVESEKVSARHILIKVSSDSSDQEKEEAKNGVQAILKEASGGADFAELAKKHSQGPSAPQGGDLGYFTRGQMVKPFEEAAFALEQGQISEVVETQFGYHIILVEDKKPVRQLELEEVSEQIQEALFDKEMGVVLEEWLKSVREKADIKILVTS